MQIASYEFRDGAVFQSGAHRDPTSVGEHLDMLRKQQKGELTPRDVVKDARNPNSPLHSFFEWDDSAAADKHRLDQARRLIKAVVVRYRTEEGDTKPVTAFVHIAEGETSHYRATEHALSQKDTREQVLRRAWREFQQWQRRYQDLDELAQVFEAAEDVLKQIG